MEGAVDGDDITLGDKLLESRNTANAEKLLESGAQRLLNCVS